MADLHTLQGSSASNGEPLAFPPFAITNLDVIAAAAEVTRASAENQKAWAESPDLDGDHPDHLAWQQRSESTSDAFVAAVVRVTALPVTSYAEAAAVAETIPTLSSFNDQMKDWPELALVHKLAADIVRLATQGQPTFAGGLGTVSPKVLDLVRQTRQALNATNAACEAQDALLDKHSDRPLPPAALFYRANDLITLGFNGVKFGELDFDGYAAFNGKQWYGREDIVEYLRTEGLASCVQIEATVARPGRDFDSAKATRIAEILQAKKEWDAESKAWRDRIGLTAASEAWSEASEHLWTFWPQFASCHGNSIADMIARASLIYDSRADIEQAQIELTADPCGIDAVERSILMDLAKLSFDLGLPSSLGASAPLQATPAKPDRRAMESYRTWLHNEFCALTHEMYPNQPEMLRAHSVNNAGDRYHSGTEPPASSRAERILDMFALDWRADDSLFADCLKKDAA